jgi:hypothetical protein
VAAVGVGAADRFHAKTAGLSRTTEAERSVIQRIGQNVFSAVPAGSPADQW